MGNELREFYFDLNPLNLLSQTNRNFAETLILFGYMVLFAMLVYKIVMFLVERIKPASDPAHEYNRRKMVRIGLTLVFGIIYLPFFLQLNFFTNRTWSCCCRYRDISERSLAQYGWMVYDNGLQWI